MSQSVEYPPIADYGLLSDMHSCALVSKDGSVDWACFPRFDSPSVFGRILDWRKGGYFKVSVLGRVGMSRRYVPGTNVLETTYETRTGTARLIDFMPLHNQFGPMRPLERDARNQIMRILVCDRGTVSYQMECCPRFDYGSIVPHAHLSSLNTGFAHGGSDAVTIFCSNALSEKDDGFFSEGMLAAGGRFVAVVSYKPSFSHAAESIDDTTVNLSLETTLRAWQEWSEICAYRGEYEAQVKRSALVLKALTYAPSGGLTAAATTSLPEELGGSRNWDYRFTWIRDATFALYSLYIIGYTNEAKAFKQWLEWSTVGRARDLQIMYGLGGERRLTEIVLPELEGYRGSRPVRIGNGACSQFQLDIYGELMDSAHLFRKYAGELDESYWEYLRRVVAFVIEHWREPDDGLWEARSGRQHHIFSKVMCWVALDRAIKAATALDLPGDVPMWERVREEIRDDVLEKGYDDEVGAFVQSYGSKALDAANLMIPLVRFLPATDWRMRNTIAAIEKHLTSLEGFVYRYKGYDDGVEGGEGTFNICTLWLADNLILLGETDKAQRLFDRVLEHTNDLGLLAEQIDPVTGEQLGNFPQAFSHLGIINTAVQLARAKAVAQADNPANDQTGHA
jgi:GH15 family glucan-1,4-alpha-glucosidase